MDKNQIIQKITNMILGKDGAKLNDYSVGRNATLVVDNIRI